MNGQESQKGIIREIYDKGADGIKCPRHSIRFKQKFYKKDWLAIITNAKVWEEPCLYCFIKAMRYTEKKACDWTDLNLYLKFLLSATPKTEFYLDLIQNSLDKKITVLSEIKRVFLKAIKPKKDSSEDADKGLWYKEFSRLTKEDGSENRIDGFIGYRCKLITEWYLYHYYLAEAFQVFRFAHGGFTLDSWRDLPKQWKVSAVFLLMLLLSVAAILIGFTTGGYVIGCIYSSLTVAIISAFIIKQTGTSNFFRLLFPKQLAAIFAGFVVLLLSSSYFWNVLLDMHKELREFSLLIPAFLGIPIYIYLFWEIKNRHGSSIGRKEAIILALPLFVIGLAESIFMGGLFFVLLGQHLNRLWDYKCIEWPTVICQKLDWAHATSLLSYIILAFLAGLFLQLLWGEEPITVEI